MSDYTWTDVPNNPAVPLVGGKNEPLNFKAAKDLDRIIVDVGEGDEACAYRSGAFRGRYAALSSIDASRNVVLVRQGGWPIAPKVYLLTIEPPVPPPPLPTNGQPWGSIYEADFAALPAQTISAPGSYTIDGKTWWVKGTIVSGLTLGLVNGSGLKSFSNGTPNLQLPAGTATVPFAVYFLPLRQFADFNPAAPVAFQYRIAEGVPQGSNVRPFCGLVSAAESSAAWDTRASQMLFAWSFNAGIPSLNSIACWGGTSGWVQIATSSLISQPLINYCLAVMQPLTQGYLTCVDPFSSSYPALTGALGGVGGLAAAAHSNPGIIFSTSVVNTQSSQSYLRGLRILQPKVPPA